MSEHQPNADSELGRFPALERLGRRRRIPIVKQLQMADCGAACLTMVLGYHGCHVTLDEVRDVVGIGRDGASASAILRGAEHFGLRGRGLTMDLEDLGNLPPASILYWNFNHFVVFERVARGGAYIIDPAGGRRLIPTQQLRRSFTGVALVLEPTAALIPKDPARGRLWGYVRALVARSDALIRVVITSIVLRLFALALPVLTGLVVDRVIPRGDAHLLTVVGIGMAAVLVFQLIVALMRSHLMLQLRTSLDTQLTLSFLDHLVSLPYGFFQHRSAGDLMMRVNSNTTIRDILTASTLSTLLDGSLVILYLLFIVLVSPMMGALVLGLGAAQLVVFLFTRRQYQDLMAEELEAQARAQGYLVQLMAGIETIKLAGAERRAVEHWSNLFVDGLNVTLRRSRLSALVDSIMGVMQAGSPLLVLGYGTVQVMAGELSVGTMLALNALAAGFLTPLAQLVNSALQIQLLGSFTERIDDVLRTEPEQSRRLPLAPALRGAIEVSGVSFAYAARAPKVVDDVSLHIAPGTSVAIVGRSGSGKSTLAKLLAGLYRPNDGRIRYDGRDLGELDVSSVRRQLGIVPQHPYIFGASIRRNIALGNPTLPMAAIISAARIAGIHDDIMAMPMGYETIVSDGGGSLSGGQRQRIALARALAHEPSILILDEATSQLDTRTETLVMNHLSALACTRVIIAHRLSTIVNADQIVVMDQGRLCEVGTHDQLLARNGIYAQLVAAQTRLDARAA